MRSFLWVLLLFWWLLLGDIIYRTHVRRLVYQLCVQSTTASLSIDYFLLNYGNMKFYHSRQFTQVTYAHNIIYTHSIYIKPANLYVYLMIISSKNFFRTNHKFASTNSEKKSGSRSFQHIHEHHWVISEFTWMPQLPHVNKLSRNQSSSCFATTSVCKCIYIGASIVITLTVPYLLDG